MESMKVYLLSFESCETLRELKGVFMEFLQAGQRLKNVRETGKKLINFARYFVHLRDLQCINVDETNSVMMNISNIIPNDDLLRHRRKRNPLQIL